MWQLGTIDKKSRFEGLPMSGVFSEEPDKSSDRVLNTELKLATDELSVEYSAEWAAKAAMYYFYNERNNNLVLQLVINSVTNQITLLKEFLDRTKSEIFWYGRFITTEEKEVSILRKELMQTRKINRDISLRNDCLEKLMKNLEELKKRNILASRWKNREQITDSKLAVVQNVLPVVNNEKVIEQFETTNTSLKKKDQDNIKKIEDTLARILDENKKTYDTISQKLESLKNRKKNWWQKPLRKLVKRGHNIFGNIKDLF